MHFGAYSDSTVFPLADKGEKTQEEIEEELKKLKLFLPKATDDQS